jgi:hypothetical protein
MNTASLALQLKHLCIIPLLVVHKHDRRPHMIIGYSYYNINDDSAIVAPADGFYRVWILPAVTPKLGVVFQQPEGEEPLIDPPLDLPMGWVNSAAYFTTTTETAYDLANDKLNAVASFTAHCLDEVIKSCPPANPQDAASKVTISLPSVMPSVTTSPVATHDVYVDDFLSLMQGNYMQRHQVKRSLIDAIDDVFWTPDPDDDVHHQEPVSVKKLWKGDGTWFTNKLIIGWILDSIANTITPPPYPSPVSKP